MPTTREARQPLPPPVLTSLLRRADNVPRLQQLIDTYGGQFNHVHVACCLNRLAKMADARGADGSTGISDAARAVLLQLERLLAGQLEGCTARELCNVLWVWARLGHVPAPETWAGVRGKLFGAELDSANADAGEANLMNGAVAGSAATADGSGMALQPTMASAPALFDATPQGLSNVAWSLARLGCTDGLAWLALAERSLELLPYYGPYDISNTAYAFAAAGQHASHPTHIALMCALAEAAAPRLESFCPQDVANMLWAYARADMPQPALFAAASGVVRRTLSDFTYAGVVQVLWAYATLRVHDPQLIRDLSTHMLPQQSDPDERNFALLAWALARFVADGAAGSRERPGDSSLSAGAESGDVPDSLSRSSGGVWQPFLRAAKIPSTEVDVPLDLPYDDGEAAAEGAAAPVGCAAALEADAVTVAASAPPPSAVAEPLTQLLPALVAAARPRVHSMATRRLTVLLWALASLGHADPPLFAAAAEVLTRRLRDDATGAAASPPALAHIAWSYAVSRQYDAGLYGALAAAAAGLCDARRHRPADVSLALSNVLWALGRMGHYDPALFAAASRVILQAVVETPSHHSHGHSTHARLSPAVNQLAPVMLACAFVGHEDPELYTAVSNALRGAGTGGLLHASLVNVCWSLAVLDHRDLGLLAALFREVATRRRDAFGPRACAQLFYCCLWLQDIVPGGAEVAALLPPALLEAGRGAFTEVARDPVISAFQSEVFMALESLGVRPKLEARTADQLFSLDCVVALGGRQLAVEANGPHHYLRTHPEALCGSTRLRSALLRARRFEPLPVSYAAWQALAGDAARQRLFLRRCLAEAAGRLGLQLPPAVAGEPAEELEAEARALAQQRRQEEEGEKEEQEEPLVVA